MDQRHAGLYVILEGACETLRSELVNNCLVKALLILLINVNYTQP